MIRNFDTSLGRMAIHWHGSAGGVRVTRILLPGEETGDRRVGIAAGSAETGALATVPPGESASGERPPDLERLVNDLLDFLRGDEVAFSTGLLALEDCSRFQREVLLLEHRVPRGRVTTYGLIAGALGKPGAARAVGGALGSNPFPIVIPCHRTVRSDGSLGGFGGGTAMKRRLLELEGVRFLPDGRVPPGLVYRGW